jgi:propionyl-CoA synthetase
MGYGMKPVKLGSPTYPVPGYDIRIINEEDGTTEMKRGEIGVIAVKLPLPPGSLPTLWQNDKGYVQAYMADIPGYYKTGDAGYIDEDGYLFIMARTDDIINVAGHRLSTGGMEEVLAGHRDVAECAVMGVKDELKGQIPMGFVVLNAGVNRSEEEIQKELVALVREKIGPVAAFKLALVVKRLPKTRSGKILRGVMRKIADGEDYKAPATIDDPEVLVEITEALSKAGYPAES